MGASIAAYAEHRAELTMRPSKVTTTTAVPDTRHPVHEASGTGPNGSGAQLRPQALGGALDDALAHAGQFVGGQGTVLRT